MNATIRRSSISRVTGTGTAEEIARFLEGLATKVRAEGAPCAVVAVLKYPKEKARKAK